jgi:hypothetical protein
MPPVGRLQRRFGLTIDSLHAVELVTIRTSGDVLTGSLVAIATPMQEDLIAYEGREYRPEQFLSPETVATVVALASADKLGTVAPFVLAPISALTHLVTEQSVEDIELQPYLDMGITVIKA